MGTVRKQNFAQPRKTFGTCKALPAQPHLATHKSGYCDLHHGEYLKAKKHYRDMEYNSRMGRTSKAAPDKETYWQEVEFTPLSGLTHVLDERVSFVLSAFQAELVRCIAMTALEPIPKASLQKSHQQMSELLTEILGSPGS